jgi:phosphoribosyl-AMP cyclohydrolase
MSDSEARVDGPADIKYDDRGLVPAIVQEDSTGEVLMLAYMNQESLERTIDTGRTWFYSRSRQELWPKGETSGHVQTVKAIYYDCDADTLLVRVDQVGAACHTGEHSCFYRELGGDDRA